MFLLTSLLYLGIAGAQGVDWSVGQDVNTTSGIVSGHASSTSPEVSEYLGIPFGHSTAGSARWLPSTRYYGTGRIAGASFSPDCPQRQPGGSTNQSEDCLSINVWTAPQRGEAKKAVMLWIYGGAFQGGAASINAYNGASLVQNEDVIVVNFNYRIDIFGYPGGPGLDQQNPGLGDQRLAVEWVQDNIAAFGGDPERIVLFGESAGAYSVDFYTYIWTEDPIVSGFIEQSGNALRLGGAGIGLAFDLNGYEKWYNMSRALGCGGDEAGSATVDCARNKTVEEIWAAVNAISSDGLPAFVPWIDDKTVFSDIHQRASGGQFIHKPLLGGSNYNESLLFSGGGPLPDGVKEGLDNEFRCGARDAALARTKQGVRAWRYMYANNDVLTNIGATHGDDVPEVFGNGTGMSGIFQSSWAAFAKDPESGLLNYGWPEYDPGTNLIVIGPGKAISVEFADPTQYDEACAAPVV